IVGDEQGRLGSGQVGDFVLVALVVDVEPLLCGERVAYVRLRLLGLRTLTGTEEGVDADRDKDGNDEHDHHQLDEGEPSLFPPALEALADGDEHAFPPSPALWWRA